MNQSGWGLVKRQQLRGTRTEVSRMNANISILAEIPEELHKSLKGYLDSHPDWDQDRVFAAALSLFLLQNGDNRTQEASKNYHQAARVYLETLFQHPV